MRRCQAEKDYGTGMTHCCNLPYGHAGPHRCPSKVAHAEPYYWGVPPLKFKFYLMCNVCFASVGGDVGDVVNFLAAHKHPEVCSK